MAFVAVALLLVPRADARPRTGVRRVNAPTTTQRKVNPGKQWPKVAAHYRFDGSARDSSGEGRHGTVHGATPTEGRHGCDAHAYLLDGNDTISLPVNFDRKHFTIALDLRIDEHPDSGPLCKAPCAVTRRAIFRKADMYVAMGDWGGGASYTYLDAGWESAKGKRAMTLGRRIKIHTGYQHLAIVYDRPTRRIYIDGELVDESDVPTPKKDSYPIVIGDAPWDIDGFVGAIDDMRVLNRALSSEQIADLYADIEKTPACVTDSATKRDIDPRTSDGQVLQPAG